MQGKSRCCVSCKCFEIPQLLRKVEVTSVPVTKMKAMPRLIRSTEIHVPCKRWMIQCSRACYAEKHASALTSDTRYKRQNIDAIFGDAILHSLQSSNIHCSTAGEQRNGGQQKGGKPCEPACLLLQLALNSAVHLGGCFISKSSSPASFAESVD